MLKNFEEVFIFRLKNVFKIKEDKMNMQVDQPEIDKKGGCRKKY
jgi:hypothetical protein